MSAYKRNERGEVVDLITGRPVSSIEAARVIAVLEPVNQDSDDEDD